MYINRINRSCESCESCQIVLLVIASIVLPVSRLSICIISLYSITQINRIHCPLSITPIVLLPTPHYTPQYHQTQTPLTILSPHLRLLPIPSTPSSPATTHNQELTDTRDVHLGSHHHRGPPNPTTRDLTLGTDSPGISSP